MLAHDARPGEGQLVAGQRPGCVDGVEQSPAGVESDEALRRTDACVGMHRVLYCDLVIVYFEFHGVEGDEDDRGLFCAIVFFSAGSFALFVFAVVVIVIVLFGIGVGSGGEFFRLGPDRLGSVLEGPDFLGVVLFQNSSLDSAELFDTFGVDRPSLVGLCSLAVLLE